MTLPASVAAANRPLGAEVCLIDVRDSDGELVRRVPAETAQKIANAGVGEAIGFPLMKYIRLASGVDAGAALGLHRRSSRTWAREQHQNSKVRHTRACESFKR